MLALLQPDGRDTDATELDAVWQPVHAGGVVVVDDPKVVEVDDPKVVEVGDPKVVDVAGCAVVGGVVGGSEVVVLAGGAVDGVGDVVAGLPDVVVVTPGAALGTVVGLVWWVITLGTTRPATTATTSTPTTTAPMAMALSRPRGPPEEPGPGGAA